MSVLAPFLLCMMVLLSSLAQQWLLLQQAEVLFTLDPQCPVYLWEYSEAAEQRCIPPRSDHGYQHGRNFRAADALCWFVRRSTLPGTTAFYPDIEQTRRAFRCSLP